MTITSARASITRAPGPVPIRATYFQSWAALADELGVTDLATRCVISDLHLGAWRGHWIGQELGSQLGIELPARRQPNLDNQHEDESRYLGALTDNEGRGDFNTLMAYELASGILAAMHARGLDLVVVLAPAARSWGRENVLLLDFLARGGCELVVVFSEPAPRVPSHWELRWATQVPAPPGARAPGQLSAIPGIIPQRFAVPTSDALALADGRLVVSPRARLRPGELARAALGEFLDGAASREYQWLAAYAFCDDHADDGEVAVLFASARDRAGEGGDDIVTELLTQAKRKTSDIQLRGFADTQLQSALLRLRRWKELVDGPLPVEGLDARHQLGMHFSKAWGLVMTNRADLAEAHFQRTRELCAGREDSKFYLYVLNISALNKLRIGRTAEAFELEKIIERRLAAEQPTDWCTVYINTINQARLYKRENDLAEAQRYYDRAFAITDGLRSPSDLLYTCLCRAQMQARVGDHAAAVLSWIRAAIHWLANPIPEALAPRVAEAVCSGAVTGELVETVSARLHELVAAAWASTGNGAIAELGAAAPSFHATADRELQYAVGAPGWSVFVGVGAPSPIYTGAAYARLARQIWSALRMLAGDAELPDTAAIFADARFGVDLPVTEQELIDAALRNGVAVATFAGRRLHFDRSWLDRTAISLAPPVATLAHRGAELAVTFKRYLDPITLAAHETELVRALSPDSTVASLTARFPRHDVLAILRGLEAKRVVRFGERIAHPAIELVGSLASLVVHAKAEFAGVPPLPARDVVLRVSRFAYLRHDRELVLHSPRGHAHLVVLAPEALAVYHALCGGRTLGALEAELSIDPHQLAVFVRLALAASIVVLEDERTDPALRTWQFHDLLFLSETRLGRHTGGFGGNYRFAHDEPPPAVKEIAWGDALELARPATTDALDELLARRRTIRRHGAHPITVRQIGELLYRSARVLEKTDAPWQREFPMGGEYTRRLYPNAGSRYGLELYLTANRCDGLARGMYYYDAVAHRLVTVSGATPEVAQLLGAAARASGSGEPQLLITIASRFARTAWKYESIALALELKNVGVVLSQLYLVATAMELAPCALGAGNSELFCRIAKTDYLVETSIGELMLGTT